MRAYRTEQIVPESHLLTLQLPPGTPTGPAQIIVLFDESAGATAAEPGVPAIPAFAGLEDFMRWLQTQPPTGRSAAEIARQIDDERGAWD